MLRRVERAGILVGSPADGRLQEGQRAGAAVEAHARSERDGHVDRIVPDGQEANAREARLSHEVIEHVAKREAPVGVLTVGEIAQRESHHPLEDAREPEMGPHPVDPVRPLADVLEEEHRAGEVREPRRAEEARDDGEVPPEERSLDDATHQGRPGDGWRRRGRVLQDREEPVHDARRLGGELGDDRAVHAHAADGLERGVESRDVGEADEHLGGSGDRRSLAGGGPHARQDPHAAVAATRGHDTPNLRDRRAPPPAHRRDARRRRRGTARGSGGSRPTRRRSAWRGSEGRPRRLSRSRGPAGATTATRSPGASAGGRAKRRRAFVPASRGSWCARVMPEAIATPGPRTTPAGSRTPRRRWAPRNPRIRPGCCYRNQAVTVTNRLASPR